MLSENFFLEVKEIKSDRFKWEKRSVNGTKRVTIQRVKYGFVSGYHHEETLLSMNEPMIYAYVDLPDFDTPAGSTHNKKFYKEFQEMKTEVIFFQVLRLHL